MSQDGPPENQGLPHDGQAFQGRMDRATRRAIPSRWAIDVHLFRHGEVEEAVKREVRGQIDSPLSARGVDQHQRLANWIQSHLKRPDRVVSSDLSRCRLLAEQLGENAGQKVEVTPELREQSMGDWEGRTWEALQADDSQAVTAYWDDYYRARPTGGESLLEVESRVLAWWRSLVEAKSQGRLFVITHIGVIRLLLCHWLGVDPRESLRFAPAFASHTSISAAEAGAVIHCLGERAWMSPPSP